MHMIPQGSQEAMLHALGLELDWRAGLIVKHVNLRG